MTGSEVRYVNSGGVHIAYRVFGDGPVVLEDTMQDVLAVLDAAGAERPAICGDLEVRAAVHTGEVELRDGDIGGIAVHIASRVMGLARPNEVLVSSAVKDLVAGAEIRSRTGVSSPSGGCPASGSCSRRSLDPVLTYFALKKSP
jgi:class 3 adenylate cyclase